MKPGHNLSHADLASLAGGRPAGPEQIPDHITYPGQSVDAHGLAPQYRFNLHADGWVPPLRPEFAPKPRTPISQRLREAGAKAVHIAIDQIEKTLDA